MSLLPAASLARIAPPARHPIAPTAAEPYRPGVCNIGPAEIARRRRGAWAATIITIVVAAMVVALGVPHVARLLIALPATAALVSWLQVVLRFCVAFARLGVFNFGELGPLRPVTDRAAHRADQRRAAAMLAASLVGGLAIGIVAALLP